MLRQGSIASCQLQPSCPSHPRCPSILSFPSIIFLFLALPRAQLGQLQGWGLRALGAHQNSLETFPMFVAGVFSAKALGGDAWWTGFCSVAFILLRVLYVFVYIVHTTRALSYVRTVVFVLAQLAIIGLFIIGFNA
jgi:uncharacterized MAPEG superfamily protein